MKRFFSILESPGRDFLKSSLIVLAFVFAHALTCLLLHDTKVGDGIFLTCLTIGMVYVLIRFYKASFDVFLGLAFGLFRRVLYRDGRGGPAGACNPVVGCLDQCDSDQCDHRASRCGRNPAGKKKLECQKEGKIVRCPLWTW